jgi:magnesium-protoporphyrin IX monomethyl ester (oxidative) cyclase
MARRVLLVAPPFTVKKTWTDDIASFPLGLAYIASSLREKGHAVEILDCYIEDYKNRIDVGGGLVRVGMSESSIIGRIEESAPDVVGVSIPFSCQLQSALDIGRIVKGLDPQITTVAGGNHPNAAPETIDRNSFDWIILGEGERSFPMLLDSLDGEGAPGDTAGAVRSDDPDLSSRAGEKHRYIDDLDSLPFAAYDLLPMEKYWEKNSGRPYVNMIATRGCPFDCVFCSIHTIMGSKVRRRSVDSVLEEIDLLRNRFGIEEIWFEDDNLTAHMAWAKELFKGIVRRDYGLSLYFRNGIRGDRVDLELLTLMRRAGGRRVCFAPESGSQETLDRIINKRMKLEDVEKAIVLARKAGLAVTSFLVIGFPEETIEDVRQTIGYAEKLKKLGCDSIWISCAMPYPGTRLYAQCIERGILPEGVDYQDLSTMDAVISNSSFTAGQVKSLRDEAMKRLNRPPPARRLLTFILDRVPFGDRIRGLRRRRN